jgi:hypothetical protein
MDPAGAALAIWIQGERLLSARRPAGGTFGAVEDLGPARDWGAGASRISPSVTVDAGGRALAVWLAPGSRLMAATRPPDGPWSAPVELSALREPVPPPAVDEPPVTTGLLSRVGLSRRPACALRKVLQRRAARRTCRPAGAVLSFRLAAAGEVRVTVQRRGRGPALRSARIAAGAGLNRVRLLAARPLPPGRYTVRIRATAVGWSPGSAARQLLVAPPA